MKRFSVVLLVVLLAGCAAFRPYKVQVNTLSADDSTDQSFVILPADPAVPPESLQFREYAEYVARALELRGYTAAEPPEEADLAIFLAYGVGDPQEHHSSFSLPVYGQAGVSSAVTHGTVTSYGNSASYSGTTTYTPSYGIVGFQSFASSTTSYFRYLALTAFDLPHYVRTGEARQVWQTAIGSRGANYDLREAFPVMVAAAAPHIGKRTSDALDILMMPMAPEVRYIKGEPVQPRE